MVDAPKINEISLGKLKNIDNTKNANIIVLPMPTADSDETEVFDMLGVTRTITLGGTFVGTTAEVVAAIDALEGLCSGNQTSVELYVDEISATAITVMIESVRSNWNLEGPSNRCDYTIKLVQGTAI